MTDRTADAIAPVDPRGSPRLADLDAALAWLRARLGVAADAVVPAGATTGRLVIDSRQLRAGDAFIAWPGAATDGRCYVADALAAGAAACLVEAEGAEAWAFDDPRVALLSGLKPLCGPLAARWQGEPATALDVVAITGTNGKSSSAWWLAQVLSLLQRPCEVVGTLGIGRPPLAGRPGTIDPTGLTTPDPVRLHAGFARMRDEGVRACAIEASSIGLAEARMAGMPVRVAVFTNFTRDHLDYHVDMAAYWAAKRALFDWPGLQAAVVNTDDAQGLALARELARRPDLALWTVGLGPAPLQAAAGGARLAHLGAQEVGYVDGGLAFTLDDGVQRRPVRSTLIGDYNVHNLLGVLGAVAALGLPLAQAVAAVPGLSPVPGRMQRVEPPAGTTALLPEVVVDYAHTPDALDKALGALRPLAAARGGRLHAVFGCGGNRDATKRPLMAAIAERLADAVVLTSDNPRHEDPLTILAQIRAGLVHPGHVTVEPDRAAAIAAVVAAADGRDVILIAGKGHEDYQEIAGQRQPFDDARHALSALQRRAGADR
ncbi:MAG: hypothetical protein RIQ53_1056 [Pseudomonadota bacterium]